LNFLSFLDSFALSVLVPTADEPQVMASTKKESTAASPTTDANSHVRCLPSPPTYRLTIADLFDTSHGGGKPRLDCLREHLHAEGRLEEDAALMIIERGEHLLRAECTLIDLEAPITGRNHLHLSRTSFRLRNEDSRRKFEHTHTQLFLFL
jgi:hypothetical protein